MFRLLLLFTLSSMTFSLSHAESGVLEIDWSELQKEKRQAGQLAARKAPYPGVLSNGIAKTTLPVLLPSSLAYDKDMSVVAAPYFYTISFDLDEATLIISGDRTFQQTARVDDPTLKSAMPAAQIDFVRSEGMMASDFNRYGANYSLVLECKKPDRDTRCMKDDYLRGKYNELIVVGGQP